MFFINTFKLMHREDKIALFVIIFIICSVCYLIYTKHITISKPPKIIIKVENKTYEVYTYGVDGSCVYFWSKGIEYKFCNQKVEIIE